MMTSSFVMIHKTLILVTKSMRVNHAIDGAKVVEAVIATKAHLAAIMIGKLESKLFNLKVFNVSASTSVQLEVVRQEFDSLMAKLCVTQGMLEATENEVDHQALKIQDLEHVNLKLRST